MKQLLIAATLLLACTAYTQQLPVNCDLAVSACSDQYELVGTNPPYNILDFGTGTVSNPSTNPGTMGNAGCLLSGETVSTFFTIHINSSGNLQWSAIIVDNNGDPIGEGCLDWILWNVTNSSCSGINGNTLPPVACNWNGMCNGNSGMASPANYPPDASPASYEAPLLVTAGQTYVLCLSNYSGTTANLDFSFFGTAGISCGVDAQDQSVCGNGSVSVTIDTPGYDSPEFTWLNTTGVSDPNSGTNVTVTPLTTTTYDVAVYQAPVGGLQELYDTATFTVFVESPVFATTSMTGTTTICAGDPLEAEGFPAQDVSWQWLLDGAPMAGSDEQTLSVTTSGDYALVVGNSCGTDTSDAFTVEVIAPLIAAILPAGPTQFCNGESVALTAMPAGVDYEWLLDGQTIADSVSASFTASEAGNYSVVVSDACSSDTGTVAVTVDEPLEAILDAVSDTLAFCEGQMTVIGALPSDAAIYSWILDGSAIPDSDTSYLDVYDAGTYAAVVGNSCGSDTTEAVTVIVYDLPALPDVVLMGSYLGVDPASVTGSPTYQWFFNGDEIPGATADTIVPLVNGMYAVIVTNEYGCASEPDGFLIGNAGLNEQAGLSLQIAPNPTSDVFTVSFTPGTLRSLTLLDAGGKQIVTQFPEQGEGAITFDLSAYANGVYLLHVEGDSAVAVERIVLSQ